MLHVSNVDELYMSQFYTSGRLHVSMLMSLMSFFWPNKRRDLFAKIIHLRCWQECHQPHHGESLGSPKQPLINLRNLR